jgi:hypothetical protein
MAVILLCRIYAQTVVFLQHTNDKQQRFIDQVTAIPVILLIILSMQHQILMQTMNPSSTASQVGQVTSIVNFNNESSFSLLHDDDDEEVMPPTVGESASTLERKVNNASINDNKGNSFYTSDEDYYHATLEQATKWMVELEQLRDTTTWCHVENSFHRDVFAMMDVQTSFNYPSI